MYFLDLIGTFAFAITGALKAKGRDLHIFGVIFLGAITAVGGGTIRDVVIGRTPLFYLKDPFYILLAVAAGLLTFYLPTFFKRWYSFFRFIDTIGLAAFVIMGVFIVNDYLFYNNGPTLNSFLVCILMGMLTGFGGGIVRDVVMGDMPFSFRKGSNYVTSAFYCAFSFYILMFLNIFLAVVVSFTLTLFFREIISTYGIYKKIIKR